MTELQNSKKDISEESDYLIEVAKKIILISHNQEGIQTDGRGMRAMKIFTRQTLSTISLLKLLPSVNKTDEIWDITSFASIKRNIIECFINLYYFGTEKVSESEAELRFFLLQYHKNNEWFNIRKKSLSPIEYKEFDDGLRFEKERLKNHPFLEHLELEEKNRTLKGYEIYKSKSFFEKELIVCNSLREHYRLLSNLVHPLPLSVERTNNINGRGMDSEADLNYFLICIMLSRKYLAATLIEIRNKFNDTLGKQFKNDFDNIEKFITKGFEKKLRLTSSLVKERSKG